MALFHGTRYGTMFNVEESVLGRWLASKPGILKIEDIVFAHGGVTPTYAQFDVEEYNDSLYRYLYDPMFLDLLSEDSAVVARYDSLQFLQRLAFFFYDGTPFWYRGYVQGQQNDTMDMAKSETVVMQAREHDTLRLQLDYVLDRYDARLHVVAHTPVESVAPRFGGKLVAVDLLKPATGNAPAGSRQEKATALSDRFGWQRHRIEIRADFLNGHARSGAAKPHRDLVGRHRRRRDRGSHRVHPHGHGSLRPGRVHFLRGFAPRGPRPGPVSDSEGRVDHICPGRGHRSPHPPGATDQHVHGAHPRVREYLPRPTRVNRAEGLRGTRPVGYRFGPAAAATEPGGASPRKHGRGTAGTVVGLLTTGGLVAIFVVYLLAGRRPAELRTGFYAEIDAKVQRYIVTKVAVSATTGTLVGLILWLFGLELALVFGVAAFLLNFIPSVGSIVATLLPLPIALIQYESIWPIIGVLALPGAVQITIGNGVEPILLGESLDLHPVVVLLALIFWGMLWGVVGMLLAAPITAILRIVLARIETTRPVAEILAGRLPAGRVTSSQ